MPFLWKHKRNLLTNPQRPSPKHDNETVRNRVSIERVSLPASARAKLSAGMTVEAAMVLPLFLFFFLNLSCAIEMIRLHGNLELALWNAGNRLCLYGYVLGSGEEAARKAAEEDHGWWEEAAGFALSYTCIKSEIVNYAGETYLEESPLSHGTAGLQFWESDIPADDDTVDILMTYQVSPWADIPFVRPFRMQNRYYGHLWTGYAIPGNPGEQGGAADLVYITDNAAVYHESLECTHLKLSVWEVTMEEAAGSRNESGERYKSCSKCRGRPFQGTVFIAREGDFYHYDRGCPGLKRTIHTIARQQAKDYRPCSRCGR